MVCTLYRNVMGNRSDCYVRLNKQLESHGLEPMTDVVKDFSSGVKLIQVSPVQDDSTAT